MVRPASGIRTLALALLGLALAAGPVRSQDAGTAEADAGTGHVETVDRVVAVVGDEIVLLSEVEEELYLASLRGELSLRDADAVDQRRKQILDQLVESKILLEEARRQGVRVDRAETDQALEETVADVRKRFPDEQAFLAQLEQEGVTLDQLRASQRGKLEEQIMVRQLVDRQVRAKVEVDEREIRAYWDEHGSEIPRLPARLDLSRILVGLQSEGGVDSAAVRRAEIVKKRLDQGEAFATLARAFSEGSSAAQGGDIGWFLPADLDASVAGALRGVAPGSNTGVVLSPHGAQILRVIEADASRGLHLAQIVFLRDEKALRDVARAKAGKLLDRLQAGEDFASLARAESDDKATAERGGHVGMVPLESLDDEYRKALDGVEPGHLSGLIEDGDGFSIVRVDAREGERDATFADVHDRLAEVLRARKARDLYDALLAAAREKTFVEMRLDAEGNG